MDIQEKQLYEAPSTIIVEVRQEGVICMSPGEIPQWDPEGI